MKKRLIKAIVFPALLLCSALRAQSFEGKITYDIRIQSKLPSVTSEQFTKMLGNRQEYYIKGNHYKTVANGAVLQWQLYLPEENRLYSKMSTTNVLCWNDGAENKDSLLSFRLLTGADTILGYPCSKLVLTSPGGTQEYLFNAAVAPADPALFVKHKLANWYEMLRQAGALPLQYTLDNPQFKLTGTALSVTPETVADSVFLLPAGAETEKAKTE